MLPEECLNPSGFICKWSIHKMNPSETLDVKIKQSIKFSYRIVSYRIVSYRLSNLLVFVKESIMGFKRRFFGDKYLNREGLLDHLYYRLAIRGWFIDLPILIAVCYFIPWGKLYDTFFLQAIIQFMEPIIPNIQENRANSNFPEYAVAYLSVIHSLGFISLLFPIFYSRRSKEVDDHLINSGHHPLKIILFGVVVLFVFIVPPLSIGAITYFGCDECSYHNKLSLIAGAIVPWALLNFLFLYTLIVAKNLIHEKLGDLK